MNYILFEGKDREADKLSALKLLTILKAKLTELHIIRLGRKVENKHRSLLDCKFKSTEGNKTLLFHVHSYLLHRHDQFQKVFVAPDRTQLEREKHIRLVTELKLTKLSGDLKVSLEQ